MTSKDYTKNPILYINVHKSKNRSNYCWSTNKTNLKRFNKTHWARHVAIKFILLNLIPWTEQISLADLKITKDI